MDWDSIILRIGGFGRYQRRTYILFLLCLIFPTTHFMVGVFSAAQPNFRCLLPNESTENATYQLSTKIKNLAYPWDNGTESWFQCERYDIDIVNQYQKLNGNLSSIISSTVKCDSFVYDKSTYKLTIVTEFNLVCDDAWLRATADSLFIVGLIMGSIILGYLSDKHGRRPIFLLSYVGSLISGLLVAAAPGIIPYVIFRMILGCSTYGLFITACINAVEMVSTENTLVALIGMEIVNPVGYLFTAGFAYFITNWRFLQIAITLSGLTFFLYYCFIPESVQWLLSKGRSEEAKYILQKISSENGLKLSQDTLDSMANSSDHENKSDVLKTSIFDLFRDPNLRKPSLILSFCRFVVSCVYLGLSWNTSNLAGNTYINVLISGLVEIPANIIVILLSNKLRKKMILYSSLFAAGSFLLLTTIVPCHMSWLVVVLTMFAKLTITSSSSVSASFTADQYPTAIKSVGIAACFTCGHLGGLMAPIINHLSTVWILLPSIIFGSGTLLSGFLVLILNEKSNVNYLTQCRRADTLEDTNHDCTKRLKSRIIEII